MASVFRTAVSGMIWGQALADAAGMPLEGRVPEQEDFRDRVFLFPYHQAVRDFAICDWTDDTDQAVLMMDSLVASEFQASPSDFAGRLADWCRQGFPELGDTRGMGIGGTTLTVIQTEGFRTDPHAAARDLWQRTGCRIAANGALMRTCPVSIIPNVRDMHTAALALCRTTHTDPRCEASVLTYVTILWCLIHRPGLELAEVYRLSVGFGRAYLQDALESGEALSGFNEPRYSGETCYSGGKGHPIRLPKSYADIGAEAVTEFVRHCDLGYAGDLAGLRLADARTMGYTFKCLGCALYSLGCIRRYQTECNPGKRTTLYEGIVRQVAMSGGDADTNAAVAGAVAGAYVGYGGLPREWISATPNRTWLDGKIAEFLEAYSAWF